MEKTKFRIMPSLNHEVKISPEFKNQARKAIISILLFAFTYLLILIASVGIAAFCIGAGIMLIISVPSFVTLAIGAGLASLGVLLLIFLLKFIFESKKTDRSHLTEITRNQEPELFALVDEIVERVQTKYPKKIYLSSDVNAAVFYDSNFWSMFLPVQKNLVIGLGLVTASTRTELKAILAHEFGHFSQKTMKVGSYVNNLNQIIFNMLFENASFEKIVHRWANINFFFSIFVSIAVGIIQGIQALWRKMYGHLNKSYLALSREMEFHADEIAASITGYEPLKSSLLRMSLADQSFNQVLGFYEAKIATNQKSINIYQEQAFVMNFLAKDSNVPIVQGFAQISVEELNKFNKSKLIIKDQWNSHPSVEDRILHLEQHSQPSIEAADYSPASVLFKDIETTQEALTKLTFNKVEYQGEVSPFTLEEFQKDFRKEYDENTFSKIYNGYYDHKNPAVFELEHLPELDSSVSFDHFFSDHKVHIVYSGIALQNDIEILKQIQDKKVDVKSFDYDGKRFRSKDAKALIETLDEELASINEQIKENDALIYVFFKRLENKTQQTPKIEALYTELFAFDEGFDAKYAIYTELVNDLEFIQYNLQLQDILNNLSKVVPIEKKLKVEIKMLLSDDRFESILTEEIKANLNLYVSKSFMYFEANRYNEQNLETLFAALNNYAYLLSKGFFLMRKELLSYQETLLN